MTTYQESFLESSFQKIARIIARRYGVTVTIRGGSAHVDMKTMSIVLPSLGNSDKLELEHLDGFLDHECAHVKFTSTDVFEKTKGNKTLHGLWNGCEDVWIERAMGKEFYGCSQNMERLNVWLYEKCEERWPTMDPLGRLHYALERCYRGDYDKEKYEGDDAIGGIISQLQDEIERGRACTHSGEAFSIAESIYEKIKQLADDQDPNGEGGEGVRGERGGDDADGSGSDSSGDDESDGDDSDGGSGSGSSETSEDDEEKGSGGKGVSQSGDEHSVDDAPSSGGGESGRGDEADSRGKRKRGSDADKKKRKAQLKKGQEQAKGFMCEEASGGFDKPLDVEGLVNEMITEFFDWSTANDPDRYIVFSEELDYEVEYDAKERKSFGAEYNRIRDEVKKYVGNLSNILELTLQAEAENRWVGGARRGKKFDQRRLAAWMEGSEDDRLFRYMEEGVCHDTAITLLWDCSGSMGSSHSPRNKAALARVAAVAFHEALRRCHSITHEVLGFNTDGDWSEKLNEMGKLASSNGDDLSRYSRVDERDKRMVFVPFGSDDGRPLAAITGGAANRDGECVMWAAKRLAQRPEKRKILIVGSDGHPQGARYHRTECDYLREVVKRVMAAGLEVYGLGIMDDAVSEYYPKYQVIQNAQELPRAVMTLLAASLPAQNRGRTNERFAGI